MAVIGTHPLAGFASRQPRLTLVSKFFRDANLHNPPPKRKPGTNGRLGIKGGKQPSPEAVVAKTHRRKHLHALWYEEVRGNVAVVTDTAHWDMAGEGLIAVCWVFVEELTGTHRDEYFFTTDIHLTPKQIIEAYTGRWAIEVMFEEAREHIGLETTRGHCGKTVLRAEPSLFGLYTLIALWFSELPEQERRSLAIDCTGSIKQTLTFSDAAPLVRRHLWQCWHFECPVMKPTFKTCRPRKNISY